MDICLHQKKISFTDDIKDCNDSNHDDMVNSLQKSLKIIVIGL